MKTLATILLFCGICSAQVPTVIQPTDELSNSRTTINDNFALLHSQTPAVANYVLPSSGGLSLQAQCVAANSSGVALALAVVAPSVPASTCVAVLSFLPGGMIQPASGQVVTIGSFTAGLTQIFDISSGGSVSITTGSMPVIYPQWWGALGDGVHDDAAAISAGYGACNGTVLQFSTGNFKINSGINILNSNNNVQTPGVNGGCSIAGAGVGRTIINTTSTSAIALSAVSTGTTHYPFYDIHDLTIQGPDDFTSCIGGGTPTGAGGGLKITGVSSSSVRLQNLLFTGFCGSGGFGLWLDQAEGTQVDKIRADYDDIGIILGGTNDVNSSTFNKVEADQNHSYGMKMLGVVGGTFTGLLIQSNYQNGLYMSLTGSVTCASCWFENNNFSGTSGKYALIMDSTLGGNTSNMFLSPVFADASDTIYLSGDAVGGHVTSGNYFLGISPSGFQQGATVTLANTYATGNTWSGILPGNFVSDPTATEIFLDMTGAFTSGARTSSFPTLHTGNLQAGTTLAPGANTANIGAYQAGSVGTGKTLNILEIGTPFATETHTLGTGDPTRGAGVSIFQDGSNFSRWATTFRQGSSIAIGHAFTGNGTTTWGTLTPTTFSLLPACSGTVLYPGGGSRSPEGSYATISDSSTNTWGATITGGGSNHVLGYCDGTNWTVAGK